MPERYSDAILKHLASRGYHPLKQHQLARQLGVADEEYDSFREAVKQLRDSGRIVLGAGNALTLPGLPERIVGVFRQNARGFGFVTPEIPFSHGDLYVPMGETGGAMTGDKVEARVLHEKKGTRRVYSGTVTRIVERSKNKFVGVLQNAGAAWFVVPEGKQFVKPIVVRDISTASPSGGTKVVIEIVSYGDGGELPTGVIVEQLGQPGQLAVETDAVIRAYGLAYRFSEEALEDARRAVAAFDPEDLDGREDLTGETVVTIDPPDARDFDDAISLKRERDGLMTLGVHIADVAHFVREGTQLDKEAKERATSVYFPKRVVPMLPEILSNGVCSLQEGQRRYCKSACITYDREGRVVRTRLAETVIRSSRRLTYLEAQAIIDGHAAGHAPAVVALLGDMYRLARAIEARRAAAGMIHLDLPQMELVFGPGDKVTDAVPADDAYTHTLIEMFMVEANEAAARVLERAGRTVLRRIHPPPDFIANEQLNAFLRAAGHTLPKDMGRSQLQQVIASVRGKPESYAVNMAVLRTFEQAEYSPRRIGHYALASEGYCHFTSPIRRYPDLTVERLVAAFWRKRLDELPPDDFGALTTLGEQMTYAERRAEAAEAELREVLVLQFLETRVGDELEGVITGVTSFGIFVQVPRFLTEGLVHIDSLGDDWWEVNPRFGFLRGERTGRTFHIGHVVKVRIAAVETARRQLILELAKEQGKGDARAPRAARERPHREKRPPEARGKRAHAKRAHGKQAHGKREGGTSGRRRR